MRTPLFAAFSVAGLAAALALVGACGGASLFDSKPKIRRVLFVTLDTTRADRLGCYGYAAAHTPTLDSLAENGVLFESAYACTPMTLPSHATMMTGTFPVFHGVRNNGRYALGDAPATLAQVLQQEGWETAAFVSAFVLDSRFGLARGFDVYDDDLTAGLPMDDPLEIKSRDAMQTAERALAWLEREHDEDFFVWVHFFDPHAPYEAPEPFASRFPDSPYDAEVAYMDAALGRIVDQLKEWDVFDETLLVVAGDHGEGLGDHGEDEHGLFLYDETMRVPLVFSAPAVLPSDRRVAATVRTADIAATVADMLGMAFEGTQGKSLAAVLRGTEPPADRPAYLETRAPLEGHGLAPLSGVVRGREKFIRAPRPELYNLRDDPRELRNLWSLGHPASAAAERALKDLFHQLLPPDGKPAFAYHAMDDEAEARLKSLGYAFDGTASEEDDLSRRDPKDAVRDIALYPKALRLAESGRHAEAAEILARLIAADPMHARARFLMGALHEREGRWEEAERLYREALRLNPDDGDARAGLGGCHMQRGEREAGKALFREAMERDPFSVNAPLYLATALVQEGNFDEAMRVMEQALENLPYAEKLHNNVGLLYLHKGDRAAARKHFETALRLKPDYAQARENLKRAVS